MPAGRRSPATGPAAPAGALPWVALGSVLLGWLTIIGLVSIFYGLDRGTAGLADARVVRSDLLAPHVGGLVVAVLVPALWGRARDVRTERRTVARTWWLVPAAVLVWAAWALDVGALRAAGAGLTLTLVVACLVVALDLELVLRGFVVTFLRDRWDEPSVAVGSVLVSGAVLLLLGPGDAPVRAGYAVAAGVLLYCARRVGGGLLVPVLLHAAILVALWSQAVGDAALRAPGRVVDVVVLLALAAATTVAGVLAVRRGWR